MGDAKGILLIENGVPEGGRASYLMGPAIMMIAHARTIKLSKQRQEGGTQSSAFLLWEENYNGSTITRATKNTVR